MHMSHAELQQIKTELRLHSTAVQTCLFPFIAHTFHSIQILLFILWICLVTALPVGISADMTIYAHNAVSLNDGHWLPPILWLFLPATMLDNWNQLSLYCRKQVTHVTLMDFFSFKEMLLQSLNYLITLLKMTWTEKNLY